MSYLQDILGGILSSSTKKRGGIMSGGDFVRIPNSTVAAVLGQDFIQYDLRM